MRILHTADWHLNDRLGRIDRTDDLRKGVERVAAHCREQKVDVLVVAGDLFSELARPDALRETIRHWQDVFADFLNGGGTILTLTGNHDNENFCQTLRHAMTLAAPAGRHPGERVPPGRLYLAAEPTFLRLRDRTDTFDVQFVLMPFPTPTRYLKGEGGQKYGSPDEKNRLLTEAFNVALKDIRKHPKFDTKAPAVLAAHITVFGSEIGASLFRLSEQEDIVVQGEQFHEQYDYVALGHIHKPQFLAYPHVRYSGSIERLDLGEQHNALGAVLFEIGPKGREGQPVVLPLGGTPIYEITIADPTEAIPRLRAEYPDAHNDLVNLHIHYTAGEHNLEEVLRDLEQIFPRWYARDWKETGALGPSLAGEADRTKSFAETVREFLNTELMNHMDGDRDALLAIADELIKDCE
ncbi:metallophosphoesterase family protein [Fimbriiglobus ruber]|nr:exonuclease subunit SbcD [Fimbriiglobus ruber]